MPDNTIGLGPTPGPWTINLYGVDRVIKYSDGLLVSHIAKLSEGALCPEHGTVEANARLIAQAPKLLALAHAVVATIDSTSVDPETLDPRWMFVYEDALALIGEIEGGGGS
jgi:hypothetical protein